MKRAYVDIPEGQVHYQTAGSGEPILLLHQTPQSSDEYAMFFAPILAKSYHVIAMDTLGYGKSDPPPREYEIADYAQSIVSFLKALGIKKTSVMGHHTGSLIAVELAAAYPELVDKLILYGCSCRTPETRDQWLHDPKFWNMQIQYRPYLIKEDGSHLMELWKHSREALPWLDPRLNQFMCVNWMLVGDRFEKGFLAALRYASSERLVLIKCPTLLVCGDKDVLMNYFDTVRKLIPRCQSKVIKGAEVIPLEMAESLAQVVLPFLKNPGV